MATDPAHQDTPDDLSARREERKLVAYIRAGDVSAFERLVKAYSENLVRFAASRTGSWDVAQDIVQDVFVSIWMRHSSWQVNTSISAYLHRSVVHGVIKYARDAKLVVPVDDLDVQSSLYPSNMEADAHLLEDDLQTTAEYTIAQLPDQTRAVFDLTRRQHMSNAAAARQLGVSVKTIEKHITRALAALKKALKG